MAIFAKQMIKGVKAMNGTIFDIIRNSFVDGPGVRTTVFLKGCNLKCKWCHNPESQNGNSQMMFYKNKCTGCGKCKEVCHFDLKDCDFCGKCELYCPNDARKICGKEMTSEEVLKEVIKDKAFYDTSGGGVTFSGGECMLQIDFLAEILKKCKENGIHTAVDTAGNVKWESFEKIMPYTDMFLYDVKLATDELHKKWTGVSNILILENLKHLSNEFAGEIIIRIPVIGGVNDNATEMQKIVDILKDIRYKEVELLPYHKMGEHKYEALGATAELFSVPDEKNMEKLRRIVYGKQIKM